MSPRLRRVAVQVGSFFLAGVLLYLALRNVDLKAVAGALADADYRWLPALVAVVLLSHLMRAWRWQILLEALPPEEGRTDGGRVSLRTAFYSVMIGYMVNYAAPRLGEVVRTANLAKQERLRFSGVFGTVVVERVLDVLLLAVALVSVFFLLLDRLSVVDELFVAPVAARLTGIPALALLTAAAGVVAVLLLGVWYAARRDSSALRQLWTERLAPIAASFRDGLLTLLRSDRRGAIAASTVAMWLLYLLMAHVPFVMLGMTGSYDLSLLDTWAIMIVGALGIVIPSPGGVGSYHYITIQTLVHLFAVAPEPAATYAVLSHAAQLVLYVAVGAVCLVLQGSSLRTLRSTTAAARAEPIAPVERSEQTSS